jgi:hypothetical protein
MTATMARSRNPTNAIAARQLQANGLGLREVAKKTGWSLSSIIRSLKAA